MVSKRLFLSFISLKDTDNILKSINSDFVKKKGLYEKLWDQ